MLRSYVLLLRFSILGGFSLSIVLIGSLACAESRADYTRPMSFSSSSYNNYHPSYGRGVDRAQHYEHGGGSIGGGCTYSEQRDSAGRRCGGRADEVRPGGLIDGDGHYTDSQGRDRVYGPDNDIYD